MEIRLHDDLVDIDVKGKSKEDVLTLLCKRLQDCGCVRDTFLNAVLEREKVYPTGLPLSELGVAIPHTDVEHVVEPAIAVAVLSNTVQFQMMGSPETDVAADIVFVLAVKEPNQQLELLENLMNTFQNNEIMQDLKKATSCSGIVAIMQKELKLNDIGQFIS